MKKQSKPINTALIGAFVISGTITVFALRNNSKNAQQLYEALLEADETGENVEQALDDLRGYIYTHMNTEIGSENGIHPPIQLQATYNRLVEAEQERVDSINDTVYERAQEKCETQFGAGSLRNGRVQCVERYIEDNSVDASLVSPDLYRFDFEPPLWSPDVAGFSLLLTIILGVTLVFRGMSALVRKILS